MLELLDALRAAQFTIGVVTGGGTEFVRQVSQDLYGVGPELGRSAPSSATTSDVTPTIAPS